MVWFAPTPRSSGGRSAVSSSSGTPAWCASSAAGSRFAAAVPDVQITTAGMRVSRPMPSAVNPATRSSMRTCRRTMPRLSSSAATRASACERDPGLRTMCRMPSSTSAPRRAAAASVAGDGGHPVICRGVILRRAGSRGASSSPSAPNAASASSTTSRRRRADRGCRRRRRWAGRCRASALRGRGLRMPARRSPAVPAVAASSGVVQRGSSSSASSSASSSSRRRMRSSWSLSVPIFSRNSGSSSGARRAAIVERRTRPTRQPEEAAEDRQQDHDQDPDRLAHAAMAGGGLHTAVDDGVDPERGLPPAPESAALSARFHPRRCRAAAVPAVTGPRLCAVSGGESTPRVN